MLDKDISWENHIKTIENESKIIVKNRTLMKSL